MVEGDELINTLKVYQNQPLGNILKIRLKMIKSLNCNVQKKQILQ